MRALVLAVLLAIGPTSVPPAVAQPGSPCPSGTTMRIVDGRPHCVRQIKALEPRHVEVPLFPCQEKFYLMVDYMSAEDRCVSRLCIPGSGCASIPPGRPLLCPDGAALVVRAGPDTCRRRVWSAH